VQNCAAEGMNGSVPLWQHQASNRSLDGWVECSCAFSVNNFDTVLLIFFTGDPVGFEGGEGAEG